jgi:hypothetical protein
VTAVPHHLVPERTSSIGDNEVPPFHIDDAGWECDSADQNLLFDIMLRTLNENGWRANL